MVSLPSIFLILSGPALPLLSYIFFRWIPGHQLPPLIYTAAIIQLTSLIFSRLSSEKKTSQGTSNKPKIPWNLDEAWPIYSLIANAILVLGVIEVVYRPSFYDSSVLSFARVGYVSDKSAKILVREPNQAVLPLFVSYRAGIEGDSPWKAARTCHTLSNETDFTCTASITDLHSSTVYQYATSNNHTGSFRTAPAAGEIALPEGKFTFLTSSCIKARFPYNPFSHSRSVPGLQYLAKWIPSLHAQFMLFLGDFIYVDVPLRHGSDVENYRHEYRQVYSSPDWPSVSTTLPWLHVIDDHEIANDWDKGLEAPYSAAIDPWNIYHASVNPPPARQSASYFRFTQGPASFFMMDTRRFRTPEHAEPADSPNKTMLGVDQLSSLLAFLGDEEPTDVKWKFIISSIPFTRNWRINSLDTWAGYLHERRILLEAMWDVGLRGEGIGVVVLSGDRHEFAATAFPPPEGGKWPLSSTVHEFSTSPLSMFYLPFRSYWEVQGEEEQEVCIKYIPDGNSKFGAIELENVKGGEQGLLRFRLFVDGIETWQYVMMTPPAVRGGGWGKDAIWG